MRRLDRLPGPSGDRRTDALNELRWAMAYEGLTADKFSVMPAVMRLAAVREAVAGVPQESRLAAAYRVVVDAARELGDTLHARILRSALAIDCDSQARNLTGRRREFDAVGDLRTIRSIEDRMLETLVTMLGGVIAPSAAEDGMPAESPLWNVPVRRDPHFVGRADVLAQLGSDDANADHTTVHALIGLGGIGKTAIAVEYAYSHRTSFDVVWWVRADSPLTVVADYTQLGTALGIIKPDGVGGDDAVTTMTSWLATHDPWLLIFDGAHEPDDLAGYLPSLRGHVLVTSRNPEWAAAARAITVDALDVEDAADLVRRRITVDSAGAATTLATAMCGIPKAINLAATMFLRGSGTSLHRFVGQLRDGTIAVSGIWDDAFTTATATPGTREVLAACAVLQRDDIPIELLTAGIALPAATVEAAVRALRNQQLVQRGPDSVCMQRLVQAAARQHTTDEERRAAAMSLTRVLFDLDTLTGPHKRSFTRRVQHHAPYVATALDGTPVASDLLTWYDECLRQEDAYVQSVARADAAAREAEAAYGPDHPLVAERLHVLACTLRDLGELDLARSYVERAIDIFERTLAPDDERTARELYVLATIHYDLGDLPTARDVLRRARDASEHIHGHNSLHTAPCFDLLARIHRELGDLPAARHVAEHALAATESALGPDHPETAKRRTAFTTIASSLPAADTP